MSDFSLFSLFAAGLACMVPFAAAYSPAVGDTPSGNAISQPGLNSLVPAGDGFTITWKPTTSGPVALLLLKGPADDLKLESVIADSTENDGSYVWTPSTSLEPTDGATGYGIQLIVQGGEDKGKFQYTTQFGISNPDYKNDSSSSSAPSYSSHSTASSSGAGYPSFYSAPTAIYPTASANYTAHPTGHVKPSGYNTTTTVAPTGPVPTTIVSTTTSSASGSPMPTESAPADMGAASTMSTSFFGLVLAAGVAVFAY